MTRLLGLDVGASKIAAAIVESATMALEAEAMVPAADRTANGSLAACVTLAERVIDGAPVEGIGIGLCELVDRFGGIQSAATFDWRELDVAAAFAHLAPVTVESDVRAAALAEARHGAGRDLASFLYVNAGTGISSCLVLDGSPLVGARGNAILLGAGPLDVESVGSGAALAARFGVRSALDVGIAARGGDTRAIELIESGGEAVGAAIGFAVNLLDPEAIVLGGGLALNEPRYRAAVERGLRRVIWSPNAIDLPLIDAQFGEKAGVIGAALAASRELEVVSR